jgi:hypothetical protein
MLILFFVLLFVGLTIGLSGYRDAPAPGEEPPALNGGGEPAAPYDPEPQTPDEDGQYEFDEPEVLEAAL